MGSHTVAEVGNSPTKLSEYPRRQNEARFGLMEVAQTPPEMQQEGQRNYSLSLREEVVFPLNQENGVCCSFALGARLIEKVAPVVLFL